MGPTKGRSIWPKTNMPPMLPSQVNKVTERPRICRRKDLEEQKKVKKYCEDEQSSLATYVHKLDITKKDV